MCSTRFNGEQYYTVTKRKINLLHESRVTQKPSFINMAWNHFKFRQNTEKVKSGAYLNLRHTANTIHS